MRLVNLSTPIASGRGSLLLKALEALTDPYPSMCHSRHRFNSTQAWTSPLQRVELPEEWVALQATSQVHQPTTPTQLPLLITQHLQRHQHHLPTNLHRICKYPLTWSHQAHHRLTARVKT